MVPLDTHHRSLGAAVILFCEKNDGLRRDYDRGGRGRCENGGRNVPILLNLEQRPNLSVVEDHETME